MHTKYGYCLYYLHHPRQELIIFSFTYIISVWGCLQAMPTHLSGIVCKVPEKKLSVWLRKRLLLHAFWKPQTESYG